ncbi:hypothetical protein QQ045_018621 [Rhodiola kirilowii]
MDSLGFNPAFPFPVPATATLDLSHPPPPISAFHHHQNPISERPPPPYAEMIKSAIGALSEPEGSSKQAISKYIEQAYANLPPTHSDELAANLQILKNNGELLQFKHFFKLPGSPPLAPAAASGGSAHRKRGRPRKLKPTTEPKFENCVNSVNESPVESVALPEKRVVRPAKVSFGAEGGNNGVVESLEKKRRGRPKKINKAVLSGPSGYPKRSPGRPPKSRSVADVFNGPVETKRRGRPKTSLGDKQAAQVLKRIGRCATKVAADYEKVGSRKLGPAEPQWMVDYAHVRAKFNYIQSKMKKAIEVIKPHLMNQMMANGHIGMALQDLDQISTMDVMAVSLADPDEEPEATAEAQFY